MMRFGMAFPLLSDYKRYIEENGEPVGVTSKAEQTGNLLAPTRYSKSAKYVKDKLKKASDYMEQLPDMQSLRNNTSEDTLNAVSVEILKAERAILTSFEGKERQEPYEKAHKSALIPDDFCQISQPKNGILKIRYSSFLPPFHYEWYSRKARYKNEANQYFLDAEFDYITEAALRKFIAKNGPVSVPPEHLYLVFRRGIVLGGAMPIDSNNVYTGAITNAISRVLQHGDGWQLMSFVYTAIEDQQGPYLDVILCQKEDITKWL